MAQTLMAFYTRSMVSGDIDQALEVEKYAFPTLRPPTPFKRELQNKKARYIVAVQRPIEPVPQDSIEVPVNFPQDYSNTRDPIQAGRNGGWYQRITSLKRLLPLSWDASPTKDIIVGYLGLWFIVDDAHIVSVGVRGSCRRKGIGELLVIRAIETSIDWGARTITLEVRVSNDSAQALYEKYRFKKVGVRKRYYQDNQEDAYIMTTDPIGSEEYYQELQHLKALHSEKWGTPFPS